MTYELHYWPSIPGRGEFVRLALEAGGAAYVDVARGDEASGGGVPAMFAAMGDAGLHTPPFAPPFLKDGPVVVGQTAAILMYLAPTLKLVGRSEQARIWTHQIQLTIGDLLVEVHDTHHPIASSLYYADQRAEAQRRAAIFCRERIPKFLRWFETVLQRNPGGQGQLVGGKLSYADLSLFQVVAGLRYAFPSAAAKALAETPLVVALHDRVAALPKLQRYLQSERHIAFNEDGLFRRYPELDFA